MPVLIDTDAFCKLLVADLLQEAVALLGSGLDECFRLPALSHMLRKGRLVKSYGPEACEAMLLVAGKIPVIPQPNGPWLDRLIPITAIDPGEAELIAAAAESDVMVLSGDKRALLALKDVAGAADVFTGRIVTLEAILLGLCDHLGAEEVRRRVGVLMQRDRMVSICFAAANQSPEVCLRSYYEHLVAQVGTLGLWDPKVEG